MQPERKTGFTIASYEEHKSKADELSKNEISKGYVQRAVNFGDIEQDVGALQLAKIAGVVKGEKVRLIHDMRRNGTNSKVSKERPVLPRVKDIVGGAIELLKDKNKSEGVDFLTLDFRDAFKAILNKCGYTLFLTFCTFFGGPFWF